jgi:hypothetical protein
MLGYIDNPDRPLSPDQARALVQIGERCPTIRLTVLGSNPYSGAAMVQATEPVTIYAIPEGDPVDVQYDQGWFVLTATGRAMLHDAETYRLVETVFQPGCKVSPARAAIVLYESGHVHDDPAGMLGADGIGA